MRKQKRAVLEDTLVIWQPRATCELTLEDARECVENISGFFDVLREWDERDRAKQAPCETPHPIAA